MESPPKRISGHVCSMPPVKTITVYTLEEYEAFLLSDPQWSKSHITYEEIRPLGEFCGFTYRINGKTKEILYDYAYCYYLMDSYGIPFKVWISCLDSPFVTTFATSEYITHQMLKKGFASTPHIEAASISPYVVFSLYGNIFSGSDLGISSVVIECGTICFEFMRIYNDLEKDESIYDRVLLSEHKECGCLVSRLIDPDTTVSATNEFLQMVGLEEYCRKDITVLTDRYMCFRFVSTTALAAACFLAAIYLAWLCRKKLA